MTQGQVDRFMMVNQKYLPEEKIVFLREKLLKADESRFQMASVAELKDPAIVLLVSVFLGGLGVDRFMLGDRRMGILKLLTMGVCGILTIADWFTIQKRAKERNYERLMLIL